MRSVLLMLMVSVTRGQITSCPPSCIICSEDAIICHKLSSITEVPGSTKALMLTDGLIETVDGIVFSDFSNMSVLALSNNIISTILTNAFQKLAVLQTLLLDHNRISTQTLDRSTFSWLHKLETLDLGNNALRDINGSWFQKTTALKTLRLEGNVLTAINSSTFALSDLGNLETLDLSDNLIAYVGRDSFLHLPHLRNLDLSHNRLQNAPDAFSHLMWLSKLDLNMNLWSCNCELRELASFLKSYMQSPGKVLYRGQGMACASSDNPTVQSVLELTKANCMPANSRVKAGVVTKSPITAQRYVRDVALAAAFSCLVGVAITLAILAVVYRKLSKTRSRQEENGAKELSTPASALWNFSEGREVLSISYAQNNRSYHTHQPWDKENTSSDSGPESVENQFICNNCSSAKVRTSSMRETLPQRTNHMGVQNNGNSDWTDQWKSSAMQSWTKDVRAQDSRHNGKQTGGLNTKHFTRQDRETVQYGGSGDATSIRTRHIALRRDEEQRGHASLRIKHDNGPEGLHHTLNCSHCHQTYEYIYTGTEDRESMFGNYTPSRRDKQSEVILCRGFLNSHTYHYSHAKLQKCLSFDLSLDHGFTVPKNEQVGPYQISRTKMSKNLEEKSNLSLDRRSTKGKVKPRSQGQKKLKVKLNLNPLRRRQVHPREVRGTERTFKTAKKDKPQMDKAKKDTKDHSKQKSKKDKATKKSLHAEGSSGQGEPLGLKSSSNTGSTETATTRPVSTVDNTDSHQIMNPDLENTKCSNKKSIHAEGTNEYEAQSEEQTVQKSGPLLQLPVTTQPNNSENNTDSDIPVSTLEDDSIMKSLQEPLENSLSLLQSSDLLAESAGTSMTINQEEDSKDSRTINTFHSGGTNDNFMSVQMSVPLLQSSEHFLGSTDPAITQTIILGNTTHPQQVMDLDLEIAVSTLDLCRDTTTPTTSSTSVLQEYLSSGGGSPKRKIRLIIPEKTSNRPQSALDKKIR